MKKDNKALNDLDQEFNLFMHSQVPEVEPEDTDTIHADYKGIPMIGDVKFKPAYSGDELTFPIPDDNTPTIEGDWWEKPILVFPMVANIPFKEPNPKAFDIGQPNDQPEIARALYLDNEAQNIFIQGQDILNIRELTGKRRDNAIEALYASTVEMLNNASPDCFFVRGNTASSKNSKEIGFYLKKNPATGKNEKVNILMDSKVTKKYKKETAAYWLQNKVAFVNQVRDLSLPLSIEFTFIRDTMRRFDLINAAQVVSDLMTEYGWIPDDESVYFHPVFNKTTYYHNKMAGVLIRVIK